MIKETVFILSLFCSLAASAGQSISVTVDGLYPSHSVSDVIRILESELVNEAIKTCGAMKAIDSLNEIKIGPVMDWINSSESLSAMIIPDKNGKGRLSLMNYPKGTASAIVECKQ